MNASTTMPKVEYPGVSDIYAEKDFDVLGKFKVEREGNPIVKAYDTAYIMFERPDLSKQKDFLRDFGLVVVSESEDVLFMRGRGSEPYCYVVYKSSQARFLGVGYSVQSRDELEHFAQETSMNIEAINAPGGGSRVRLKDPNGFLVDIVHGRAQVDCLPCRREPLDVNTPWKKVRVNKPQRTDFSPSPIERFGHYVMMVTDFEETTSWYMKHIGVIPTDVLCVKSGEPCLCFFRLDRGAQPADHHTLVLAFGPENKYLHSAFETLDHDSIGQGQQYLKSKGWRHFWGMGRHILGSQIFDYWLDPVGDEHEHYADGDMFDSSYPAQYHFFDRGGLWQWGNDVPDAMRPKPSLKNLMLVITGILKNKFNKSKISALLKAGRHKPRPWLK